MVPIFSLIVNETLAPLLIIITITVDAERPIAMMMLLSAITVTYILYKLYSFGRMVRCVVRTDDLIEVQFVGQFYIMSQPM